MEPVRLAVVGMGSIGRVHAEAIIGSDRARLVAASALLATGGELIDDGGAVPVYTDYREVLRHRPEGVIVATPNQDHADIGEFFAGAGIHVLVEKPLAESVESARNLIDACHSAGVSILVGHHRRHNSRVDAAKRRVKLVLGTLVATNTLITMRKPDEYYEVHWRTITGAGPLLVNVIHEIDVLRVLFGEIGEVQASARNLRGHEFEDTFAIVLRYRSGALGTIIASDSTPSPWSWELSVPEGMGFPTYGQDNAMFLGTRGSIAFPSLREWRFEGEPQDPGMRHKLTSQVPKFQHNDPYHDQIDHFADVIRHDVPPLVDGEDALRTLAVVEAIQIAAESGSVVDVGRVLDPQ